MQLSQLSEGLALGVALPLVRALYSAAEISYVVSLKPQRSQRLRLRLAVAVFLVSRMKTARDPHCEQLDGSPHLARTASMLDIAIS
jgi:hypothetical protein